ncbi:MAG: DivIVA domain-containing protein [Pseudomonadota bacterium]|nr:DivIVA domain-containing protein [Pseudomonadota bacterium]
MKIAPIDIAHKTFGRKIMGLDPDDVKNFLQEVSQEMEQLVRERNQFRETLREKEMVILDYRDRDDMLKKTMETATYMTEKLRVDAEREAKLIINDAKQKSDLIIRDSRDSLKKAYNEISNLKRARVQFENNLKALAQAHLSMLAQGDKYMPEPMLPEHDMAAEAK